MPMDTPVPPAPIVIGPLDLYRYAVLAGLAVTDELLRGGPPVLGPKPTQEEA